MRKKALLSKVLKSLKGAGITNYDLYLLNRGVIGVIPRGENLCRAYFDARWQLRWPPRPPMPVNKVDFIIHASAADAKRLQQFAAEQLVPVSKWPEAELIEET